jgi:hypothetical protein
MKSTKLLGIVVIIALVLGVVSVRSLLFEPTNDRPISGRQVYDDVRSQGIDVVISGAQVFQQRMSQIWSRFGALVWSQPIGSMIRNLVALEKGRGGAGSSIFYHYPTYQ